MAFKINRQTENLFLTLSGQAADQLICIGARIKDRLSTIPQMRMEFYSKDSTFDPQSILGTDIKLEGANGFKFSGIFISVEDLGHEDAGDLFAAEVRPWPWLMTIGAENRVFQSMTTIDIVKKVFSDAGFTDVTDSTGDSYVAREYCVQYGESNFDFVSRLLEEDGIYYYFDYSGQAAKIVFGDDISAHVDGGKVEFNKGNRVGDMQADPDTVFEWAEVGKVVTGKVSLFDYDMTLPNADLKVTAVKASGSHARNSVERYLAGGHYKVAEKGEALARKEVEGHAAEYARAKGATNSPIIKTGGLFTLNHDERTSVNGTYLVVDCTYYLQFNAGYQGTEDETFYRNVERIDFPDRMGLYETEFEVQRSSVQFRPPRIAAWPQMPSLLTAKVTGPDGDEIYTDEYGRIKVIFPWDRLGEAKEGSSCWVRSVMPWGGKDWGMFSVPRIGMEVIIQFERGNIDRPYCTGVVYNGVNKPPYALPGDMTKSGIRTNSSKGGGGFHELTFDDKKGSETVFFQSEKDYKQIIKNNAEVTIGMEKKDHGNLTQTIYKNKTETIKTGDNTLTVEAGNDSVTIAKSQTLTVGENRTLDVGQNSELTVGVDRTETIGSNNSETVGVNHELTVGADMTITVGAGLTIEAGTSITLKVGGNTVKIDPSGITISGTLITLDAKAMTEVKAAMVKVAGSGMTMISGGIVMVN